MNATKFNPIPVHKVLLGAVALGVLLGGVLIALVPHPASSAKAPVTRASPAVPVTRSTPVSPGWRTIESYDKMDNVTTEGAVLVASEPLEFGFPYNGGSTATLGLSRTKGSNESFHISVMIDNGQFDPPNGLVEAKFDDHPVQYEFVVVSDSRRRLWLSGGDAERLADQVRTAHHLTLRVRFYPDDWRDIEFDVAGFPLAGAAR